MINSRIEPEKHNRKKVNGKYEYINKNMFPATVSADSSSDKNGSIESKLSSLLIQKNWMIITTIVNPKTVILFFNGNHILPFPRNNPCNCR